MTPTPESPPHERRRNTRWTAEERALTERLIREGVRPCDARDQGLYPGRDSQFVWNIFADTRRKMNGQCACGAYLEPGQRNCEQCLAEARQRLDDLKAQGLCSCGKPADATLTRCSACMALRRERWNGKQKTPSGRASGGTVPGLFRWLCSGSPKEIGQHLPGPVQDWTVVDVFGGSAALTLFARRAGYRVVYNDVNPLLTNVVRVVRDEDLDKLIATIKVVGERIPADLEAVYVGASQLPPVLQAAVVNVMAANVAHRNMHRRILPETLRIHGQDFFRRLKQDQQILQGVEITTMDFAQVIEKFDSPRTVFVLDPPFPDTRVYEHNLTRERFLELGRILNSIQGRFLLMSDTSRTTAEAMAAHPHVWWWIVRRGLSTVRQLVSTNYPLDFEPVDLTKFGITPLKPSTHIYPPKANNSEFDVPAVPKNPTQRSRAEGDRHTLFHKHPNPETSMSPKNATPVATFRQKLPSLKHLPVTALSIMSNFADRCNRRISKVAVINSILQFGWDPYGSSPPFIAFCDDTGTHHIIDGHNRYTGIDTLCLQSDIDPSTIIVKVQVYDMSHVPPNQTVAEFIDMIRKINHARVPETYVDELQTRLHVSPWHKALVSADIEEEFDAKVKTKLNIPTILAIQVAVNKVVARQQAGMTPDECLKGFNLNASNEEKMEVWLNTPDATARRVAHLLARVWSDVVLPAKFSQRGNFGAMMILAWFVLMDTVATPATLRPDLVNRFANKKTQKAPTDKGVHDLFGHLLRMANTRHVDKFELLGRDQWGKY